MSCRFATIIAFVAALLGAPVSYAQNVEPSGTWLTQAGDAKVKISKCGGGMSGQIYNADDGSNYASNIALTGADAMRVEGCLGTLCGGETWTRVDR